MSKRRITKQQQRRIKARQDSHIDDEQGLNEPGLVVAHHGTGVTVEDQDGHRRHCKLRQHLGIIVAGDEVMWQRQGQTGGVVTALCERKSVLTRPDARGVNRPIAANIDKMLIVLAPEPCASSLLIDSYLVAAETLGIEPCLVLNKCDLAPLIREQKLDTLLTSYEQLNYTVVEVSAHEGSGIDHLQSVLKNHTSVFVGQSGVGKSSLIATFLPHATIAVGALTDKQRLGKHTTSRAELYHLNKNARLIDSPGIREFNLWKMTPAEIAEAFIDFKPFLGQCKFRDCRHVSEPQCAIHQACKDGLIQPSRYQNYLSLIG